MFCSTCGSEVSAELKYCNRCGASLATVAPSYPVIQPPKPIKLFFPSLIMGITICAGLGISVGGAVSMADRGIHPAAVAWMFIAGMATLFGTTAMLVRFWMKVLTINRETYQQFSQPVMHQVPAPVMQPPRVMPQQLQPPGSVTEHTTRTFSPIYREGPDPKDR
jgi:hypothetical protein